MSAAWWQPYQVESASKTNFYIPQNLVNHKVPLRGTCNVQLMDQAANLSEVLAWSFILKSVLRTANIYDVSPDNNDKILCFLYFLLLKIKNADAIIVFIVLIVFLLRKRKNAHTLVVKKSPHGNG